MLVMAVLMAAAVTGCGGQTREIFLGTLVEGVTTASNPDDVGGISETYLIEVHEGVEHYIYLSSPDGSIAGHWDANANDFIVQANTEKGVRTVTYTFSEDGFHEVFLRSLDSDIPSPFTFKIWAPSS